MSGPWRDRRFRSTYNRVRLGLPTYKWIKAAITRSIGSPEYELSMDGSPRGFTVARRRNRHANDAYFWAQQLRSKFQHKYGEDYLVATPEHPLFFLTVAWYDSGKHPDPENTHKLAKDALFYLAPAGTAKDKFTSGAYAGPLIDLVKPRLDMWVWRLSAEGHIVDGKEKGVDAKSRRRGRTNAIKEIKPKIDNPFTLLSGAEDGGDDGEA